MKVLIVNNSDILGGASKAAYRLHKSLLNNGIDSKMLVQFKSSNDPSVLCLDTRIQKILLKILLRLDNLLVRLYRKRKKVIFSPSLIGSRKIIDKINELKPDIVHFHWINNGMLKVSDLPLIKAPLIFTLHDMWLFTGGCHYSSSCNYYQIECGECPHLGSNRKKI
jgi:hypothetical protein